MLYFNPQAPVAHKTADELVSKVKESNFDLGEKTMSIHPNQPLITSFYIKKDPFLPM